MSKKQIFLLLSVFILTSALSGCTYLKNRGNDAMDMFDVGITLTSKPNFALYLDIAQVLPIGFSHVDGKLIGIGRSTFGVHDFRQKGYGYLIGGSMQRGVDNYDPNNPDDPATYDVGILGFTNGTHMANYNPAQYEEGRPKTHPTCPKTLHLGWIGIEWGCKAWDMLDFILGWTTLDIGEDDLAGVDQYTSYESAVDESSMK
ncbi:MAG: hypothetical protein KKH57_01260 [Candidatus Omnitrophica bacterium]|nr:hypothetical protein [Candidatus Omnitrophota bacterium]MBU1912457.1 hypothetical protein [Candidatus Omnitrophota bacterium]